MVPKLEKEDIVKLVYDGKELTYKVIYKKETLPEEVNPYETYFNKFSEKSTLTLLTCTPPGTRKYRMSVIAELIEES